MRIATKHIYLSFRFFFFALTGKIAVINLHSYLVCTVHCQTKHWVLFLFRGGQYFTISILPWVPLFPFQQRWKWENFCCHYSIWRINTTVLFVLRSLLSIWLCVHVAVAWLYNATFFMYSLCEELKTGKHMMLALPSLHLYLQFISFLHGVCGFGGECTIQL